MPTTSKPQLKVYVSKEALAAVKALAERDGRSVSSMVDRLILAAARKEGVKVRK